MSENLRIALFARHGQNRIAGQELLQGEDQQRHDNQRRDGNQYSSSDVAQHQLVEPVSRKGRGVPAHGTGHAVLRHSRASDPKVDSTFGI